LTEDGVENHPGILRVAMTDVAPFSGISADEAPAGQPAVTPVWPINGMRHQPEGDTCGWHLWAGEDLAQDPDSSTTNPDRRTHLGAPGQNQDRPAQFQAEPAS
jgi:hypothetical protein